MVNDFWHTKTVTNGASERVPRFPAPAAAWAFVRLRAGVISMWFLLSLGLVAQLLLVWAAFELVDLYVASVELWAELAKKHLEITLTAP